jgi:crotonobetainyl-CoA:carnitine CoA-transferase CaiB-like acyl-CoA transferase
MLVMMKQPFAGEFEIYGSPFKMSETPGKIMGYSPMLGENNQEVLSRDLDYRQQDIDRLYQEGILYKEPAVDRLPEELKRLRKK